MNHGFINAVKRKVYGHINVEFPGHLLADMEIIEMADHEIENLDGIEYCTYARIIDLSGNNLTEIIQLGQLMHLEEIFVQNNHISYLDGLHELPFLRVIDLSHNDVDDLSPLFELDTLEFINVIGNRIPDWQLEKLNLAGVIVVS
jgi:Leucine-rich repeat (LRR) protein